MFVVCVSGGGAIAKRGKQGCLASQTDFHTLPISRFCVVHDVDSCSGNLHMTDYIVGWGGRRDAGKG